MMTDDFFSRHLPSDESMAECLRLMQEIAWMERQLQVAHFDEQFLKALKMRRE